MWKPGDDYAIRFSDETADDRTGADFQAMVQQMKQVANDFGFDISTHGNWQALQTLAVGEHALLNGKDDQKFVVWIDCDLGCGQPDWEINSEPKTLVEAIEETRECHKGKFPTAILPEGVTPREDGFFSNPETDP